MWSQGSILRGRRSPVRGVALLLHLDNLHVHCESRRARAQRALEVARLSGQGSGVSTRARAPICPLVPSPPTTPPQLAQSHLAEVLPHELRLRGEHGAEGHCLQARHRVVADLAHACLPRGGRAVGCQGAGRMRIGGFSGSADFDGSADSAARRLVGSAAWRLGGSQIWRQRRFEAARGLAGQGVPCAARPRPRRMTLRSMLPASSSECHRIGLPGSRRRSRAKGSSGPRAGAADLSSQARHEIE